MGDPTATEGAGITDSVIVELTKGEPLTPAPQEEAEQEDDGAS